MGWNSKIRARRYDRAEGASRLSQHDFQSGALSGGIRPSPASHRNLSGGVEYGLRVQAGSTGNRRKRSGAYENRRESTLITILPREAITWARHTWTRLLP